MPSAQLVELVFAAGASRPAAEQPIGELCAVVGQDGADMDGAALASPLRELLAVAAVR